MNKDLWNLDLDQLKALYQQEKGELEQRLLSGVAWEDVTDQRHRVGELSTIIYKKSNPTYFGNPAENASRNSTD